MSKLKNIYHRADALHAQANKFGLLIEHCQREFFAG